jgi:hypothetical protein
VTFTFTSAFIASSSPDNATESCLESFFVEYRPRIDHRKGQCSAVSGVPHALAVLPQEKSSWYPLNKTHGRPNLPTFRSLVIVPTALSGYCELLSYFIVQRDEVGEVP